MYSFLRVKRFLLCFKLETGGRIIGWLTLLLNLGLLCIWVAGIVVLSSTPCHEIEGYVYDEKQELTNFEEYCMIGMTALGILLKIAVLLSLSCAVIGFLCIIGSKQRKPGHIKPMIILLAACTVHGFFNFLSFSVFGIVFGLATGCVCGYLLICIYSFYHECKEECNRSMTVSVIGTEEQASESGEPAAEEENEDETASSHPEAEEKTKH